MTHKEAARKNLINARKHITQTSREKQARKLRGRKYSSYHKARISAGLKRYCNSIKGRREKSRRQKLAWKSHRNTMYRAILPNIRKAYRVCHTPEQRAKARKTITKYSHLGRAAMQKGPSKIQKCFSSIIKKHLPSLKFDNYRIKSHGHIYTPDIVNLETCRILEIDGEYWHELPGVKKLDRIRDRNLRKDGWKILRLSANRKFLFQKKTLKRAIAFLRTA